MDQHFLWNLRQRNVRREETSLFYPSSFLRHILQLFWLQKILGHSLSSITSSFHQHHSRANLILRSGVRAPSCLSQSSHVYPHSWGISPSGPEWPTDKERSGQKVFEKFPWRDVRKRVLNQAWIEKSQKAKVETSLKCSGPWLNSLSSLSLFAPLFSSIINLRQKVYWERKMSKKFFLGLFISWATSFITSCTFLALLITFSISSNKSS